MGKEKCWKCKKLKNNVRLRACQDRLCEECYEGNETALRKLRSGDIKGITEHLSTNDKIVQDEKSLTFAASNINDNSQVETASKPDEDTASAGVQQALVEELQTEIRFLKHTVSALERQVGFLLTFVGAVDCSPTSADVDRSPGGSNVVAEALSSKDDGIGNCNPPIASVKQSFLCQAVTTAVYVDLRNSEKKAKNVIISGLEELETETDRDLANNLFSTEFGEQPNIVHSRRLGKRNATTGRKARPLLVSFDNPQIAEHYITNAKLLRNSENEMVRDHVFINKDLTKAQAQAAYELRCQRRAAAAQRRNNNDHQSSSSSTAPMPLPARRRNKQIRQLSAPISELESSVSNQQQANFISDTPKDCSLSSLNPTASLFQPTNATTLL